MVRFFASLSLALVLVTPGAAWSQATVPVLGSVWWEDLFGNPERGGETARGLRRITAEPRPYTYADGEYLSLLSGIKLRLPQIADERHVTVREAISMRTAEGKVASTHLIFLPGEMSTAPVNDHQAISAVVVTRVAPHVPMDREALLRRWEPPNDQYRETALRRGIEYSRIETGFGETVQRIARNRASVEPFPYRMHLLNSKTLETVSVTRIVVQTELKRLMEFSQIVPCDARSESECVARAMAAADRFMGGVTELLIPPANE